MVMVRSHMAETLKAAVTFIEQGRILCTCVIYSFSTQVL